MTHQPDIDTLTAGEQLKDSFGPLDGPHRPMLYPSFTRRSKSGMTSFYRLYTIRLCTYASGKPPRSVIQDVTRWCCKVTGYHMTKDCELRIGGVGFNAHAQIVHDVSKALYGDAYLLDRGSL